MRIAPRALAGGPLAAAALTLAACGSSVPGLLSSQQAGALNAALTSLSQSFNEGQCASVQNEAAVLTRRVAQLPSSVNPKVRSSLQTGAMTVAQIVTQDCHQHHAPVPPPVTTTPPPATTKSTPSPPTSTPTPTTVPTTTNGATPPSGPGNNGRGHAYGHHKHGGD